MAGLEMSAGGPIETKAVSVDVGRSALGMTPEARNAAYYPALVRPALTWDSVLAKLS